MPATCMIHGNSRRPRAPARATAAVSVVRGSPIDRALVRVPPAIEARGGRGAAGGGGHLAVVVDVDNESAGTPSRAGIGDREIRGRTCHARSGA